MDGFRAEASLMYIIQRITGVTGADARVASFLMSKLLSMPLPEMCFKLPPIFVLSKPKMVAATTDADSVAAQFSTSEIVKTKLHLLAGKSIVNTDEENHYHGYDQLARENITTESTDVYSIAHPFGVDANTPGFADSTMRRWPFLARRHRSSSRLGTSASESWMPSLSAKRLLVYGTWGSMTGEANEAAKHTGLAVNPWDLETKPHANDQRPTGTLAPAADENGRSEQPAADYKTLLEHTKRPERGVGGGGREHGSAC